MSVSNNNMKTRGGMSYGFELNWEWISYHSHSYNINIYRYSFDITLYILSHCILCVSYDVCYPFLFFFFIFM